MFCPKCGSAQPDGSRFCSACGSAISATPVASQQGYQQPYQAPGAGAGGFDVRAVPSSLISGVVAVLALIGVIAPFFSAYGFGFSILDGLGAMGDWTGGAIWFLLMLFSALAMMAAGVRAVPPATLNVAPATKQLLALIAAGGGVYVFLYILWNLLFNDLQFGWLGFGAWMLMLAGAGAIYVGVLSAQNR